MSFRKNAFSYFIWVIFVMCNLAVFSFLGMLFAKTIGELVPVMALGIVAAFFGSLFLLYFLTGKISKRVYEKNVRIHLLLEAVLAVCILVSGVVLRIYLLPTAGETASYFEVAKVTQASAGILVTVQSSVYYYLNLLRGVFLLFGNHWIAGIWLQILLQILAVVVLYFVVRLMAGTWVSLALLTVLMFLPSSVRASLVYSPDMLYLLFWSFGMLFVTLFLNRSTKCAEKESAGYSIGMWLSAIFVGIVVGFLAYTDVSGGILLVPLLMVPAVIRTVKHTGLWIARMFASIIFACAGFIGAIYIDGILSGAGFESVLIAWLTIFQPEMPDIVLLLQNSTLEVMILLIVMAVNIFSFRRRKDRDIITVWVLMTFVLAILYVMNFTTENMSVRLLMLTLMSITAAVSVRELFQVMPSSEMISEPETKAETETEIETVPEIKKTRFIENPLPLPKKHVKKTMDYAFVPEASMMKFDIETSETDDYDV